MYTYFSPKNSGFQVPQYLIIHFEPTLTEAGEKVNRHRIIWKDTTFQKGEYKEPGKIVLGKQEKH